MGLIRDKRGAVKRGGFGWIIAVLVILVVGFWWFGSQGGTGTGFLAGSGDGEPTEVVLAGDSLCQGDDDGLKAVTLNMANSVNTTGVETFSGEYTILGQGGFKATGTNLGTSVNLPCEEGLKLYIESNNTANGSQSVITSASEGSIENGVLVFSVANDKTIDFRVPQTSRLKVKAYDYEDARYIQSNNSVATDFIKETAMFQDGTQNSTFTISNQGEIIDHRWEFKSVENDGQFGDRGFYIGIDASVSEWQVPTKSTWNGMAISDVKDTLVGGENKLYDGYEYVYFVDDVVGVQAKNWEFTIPAESDASTDLHMKICAKGIVDSSKEIGKVLVDVASDDSSSATAVYSCEDYYVDIA